MYMQYVYMKDGNGLIFNRSRGSLGKKCKEYIYISVPAARRGRYVIGCVCLAVDNDSFVIDCDCPVIGFVVGWKIVMQ